MGSYIETPPGSSSYWGVRSITLNGSDATLLASDKICIALNVITEQQLNLPSAASRIGIPFFICPISNVGNNPVTISGDGFNQQIQTADTGAIVFSDGSNWYLQKSQVI